jgi:hypothetical protein
MFSAKSRIDQKVSQMEAVLDNRGYFQNLVGSEIFGSFEAVPNQIINAGMIERLRDYTVEEYLEEYSNF